MRLAVDLGGTNIKLAAFEGADIRPLFFASLPAHADRGIRQALDRAGEAADRRGIVPDQVGIACPGLVGEEKRQVLMINGKYEDAVGFDFIGYCRDRFGCVPVMSNDANAALRGEAAYGCAADTGDAVLLILGTGIGTAAMMSGRIVAGIHHQAAILMGQMVMKPGRGRHVFGENGCLEDLAGSIRITEMAEAERGRIPSRIFERSTVTVKDIAACWHEGDALASELMEEAVGYYSAAAVNLMRAYDPEVIILSGGIAGDASVAGRIRESVARAGWMPWGVPEIRTADNPDRSVLLGMLKKMRDEQAESRPERAERERTK